MSISKGSLVRLPGEAEFVRVAMVDESGPMVSIMVGEPGAFRQVVLDAAAVTKVETLTADGQAESVEVLAGSTTVINVSGNSAEVKGNMYFKVGSSWTQAQDTATAAFNSKTLWNFTTAFRQRAKELHPDARNGDRSSEPELRRILEAYQFLKEYLSLSNTEPPISRGAEYRPTE